MTIKGQLLFTLFVCVCVPFTLKLQLFLPPLRVSSAPSSPSSRASNNPKITVMLPSSNRKGDFCWVCTCVCVHVFEVCVRERETDIQKERENQKAGRGTQAGVSQTGKAAASWCPEAEQDGFGLRGSLLRDWPLFLTQTRELVPGYESGWGRHVFASVLRGLWLAPVNSEPVPTVGRWGGWHPWSSPSASSSSVVRRTNQQCG